MPNRDRHTKFSSVWIKIHSDEAAHSDGKAIGPIPQWNTYYPSLDDATPEQRRFYAYWLRETERGRRVDIEGNLSYAFVYLYSTIETFIQYGDLGRLLARFDRIRDACSDYDKVTQTIRYWTGDAYLFLGYYDQAWDYLKASYIRVCDVINLRSKCMDTAIDGHTLIRLARESGSLLTKFGKEHRLQVAELASLFLQDFHRENGQNFIEFFCRQFNFRSLTELDFKTLRRFFSNDNEFFTWRTNYEEQKTKSKGTYEHYLFSGVPLMLPAQRVYIQFESVPYIIEVAALNEARRIIRESENTVRTELHLPRVGEGWIAETVLYHSPHSAHRCSPVRVFFLPSALKGCLGWSQPMKWDIREDISCRNLLSA